jgi:hypothetical protein
MLSNRARDGSALLFQLPQTLAETRMLPMHGSHFFEHARLCIVETRTDLDDFVACYKSGRRHERAETDRFRRLAHAELIARDKVNLDIFWLKDDTFDDPDLLPPPDEIAAEIVETLEAALDRFRKVTLSLQPG